MFLFIESHRQANEISFMFGLNSYEVQMDLVIFILLVSLIQ